MFSPLYLKTAVHTGITTNFLPEEFAVARRSYGVLPYLQFGPTPKIPSLGRGLSHATKACNS